MKQGKGLGIGLGVLQILIGLGAVAGGLGLALEPSGANLGMQVEALSGSPFPNYLIPGIVLLVVNGLGSLAGGIASLVRYRYAAEIAAALGIFLILWIVIQVAMIGLVSWLQPLYFALGAIELALGLLWRKAAQGAR